MSIFDGATTPQATPPATQTESFVEKLVATKGDSFRDPEAMAKSLLNADTHIKKLEAENSVFHEKTIQEDFGSKLLEELRKSQPPVSGDPAATPGENITDGVQAVTPASNPEDIKKLVDEAIANREHTRTKEQNIAETDKVMRQRFGDQAVAEVSKRAQELNVSLEYLADVAAKSPTAFLRMIGEAPMAQTNSTVQNSVNTANLSQNSGKRNWAHYKEMMKSDPKRYRSRAIQDQVEKDLAEQGESFWSN